MEYIIMLRCSLLLIKGTKRFFLPQPVLPVLLILCQPCKTLTSSMSLHLMKYSDLLFS